jgi:hypothetical protein
MGYLFILCLKGMFIIKKFATVVVRVDLCAPRTHPLHVMLLYSYTYNQTGIMRGRQKRIRRIKCDRTVIGLRRPRSWQRNQ